MKPLLSADPLADPLTVIKNIRSSFAMDAIIPKPSQCKIDKEVFENQGHTVDAYCSDTHQKKFQRHADHIILYFHGGGYIRSFIFLLPSLTLTKVIVNVFIIENIPVSQRQMISLTIGYL
jgi:hypothetical protein